MDSSLQSRIERLKTTALMEQRKTMGPVGVANWWTSFRQKTSEAESFNELSADIQEQILKWESDPYKIIGT